MPTPGFLLGLNDEQRDAVLHDDGPLSVLAGPGSGKTRVIIHRIARLIAPRDEGGLAATPESVLALAFTIKSANEMRSRLAAMVGVGPSERVALSTCHAFGRRIVKRFGDRLGYPWETHVADSAERVRLLRDILARRKLFEDRAAEGRDAIARLADGRIHRFRTEGITPERLLAWTRERRHALETDAHGLDGLAMDAERAVLAEYEQLASVYDLFEQECRARGWLTLDEYLTLPLRLLDERDDARAMLRNECRHIVVDEFQDWSPVQISLIERLAPRGANHDLCVVGDDDQAIYGFRGADDRAFERFERAYPAHRRVALVRNYRSAKPILDVANRIMQAAAPGDRFAPEKALVPCAEHPDAPARVEGLILADDPHAGVVIAAAIRAERARRPDTPWSAFAVIARTNGEAERAALELEACGIPSHVQRSPDVFHELAVQDLFSWLRLLTGSADAGDTQRVLLRPPVSLPHDTLREWERLRRADGPDADDADVLAWACERHAEDPHIRRLVGLRAALAARMTSLPACEMVWETILHLALADADGLDAHERAERHAALLAAVTFARSRQSRLAPPGDLRSFLEYVNDLDEKERTALASPGDERVDQDDEADLPADAVVCLTAHQAKGLEFDTVFVPRVRPGHGFPLTMGPRNDDPLPESLIGRAPPNALAEERRLFYVACTRARRRLVLLAKSKKSREGKSTDYFLELTPEGDSLLDESGSAEQIVRDAGLALPEKTAAPDQRAGGFFQREVRLLRRNAAETMVGVPIEGLTREHAQSAASALESIAARLRALAALREQPEIAPRDAHAEEYRRRHEQWRQRTPAIFEPWPAPVHISYTLLYDWESCPRCCYLRHVKRMREPAQAQMQIGAIVHTALERFLNELREAESDGRPPPGVDRLLALGHERALAMATSDREARDLRDQLRAMLRHAHELHAQSPDAHVLHLEAQARAPYRLDGVRHWLVAKLDRVDMLHDNRIRIVDYKTGEPSKAKLEPQSNDLQFCVYAMALPALLDPESDSAAIEAERDEDPMPFAGEAQYWLLTTRQRGVIDFAALKPRSVRTKINKAVREMLAGNYRVGPKCRALCRIAPE